VRILDKLQDALEEWGTSTQDLKPAARTPDEFDRETPHFRAEKDGTWLIDGLGGLGELRERLGMELEDEPYDSVGGLVFGRIGRLAKVGDAVEIEGRRFVVTALDGRRVAQVRVERAASKRGP